MNEPNLPDISYLSIGDKAEILLGENIDDWILAIYVENATNFVVDYCRFMDETEIPTTLNSVMVDMVIFQYRSMGVENLSAEGKGSLSDTYLTEYPPNIMNRLNRYQRVKFL